MVQASNPNFQDQQSTAPLTPRQVQTELAALIRRERDRNPAVMALLQLLSLRLEDIKDKLVTSAPEDFPGFQGMALQLKSLIHTLTTDPPPLPSKENYT